MAAILTPNARQLDWYKRKTAFLHFSIGTFSGREWSDGTEPTSLFCPETIDCEQWMRVLSEAGFTHAILTAKHHDGFCLWPSRYTEHCIKNSPYKNGKGDVIREFTDACRAYNIKPGLYLSPWDRNFQEWGTEAYNDYYAAQLTELMTNYGPIYECWWDGAGSTEAVYDWERWAKIIRDNQKDCIIYGSLGATPFVDVRWIGNENGKAADACYATIDAVSLEKEINRDLFTGKPDGERYIPAECDVSIRPGWFYHAEQDELVKTPAQLVNYWFDSYGKNAGILLNVPPDDHGVIKEADAASLIGWERSMRSIFAHDLLADRTGEVQTDAGIQTVTDIRQARPDKNATITYTFDKPTPVNCVKLGEAIRYGNRIMEFSVEGLIGGKWTPLATGRSMGNCFARHFDTVPAEGIRLTIHQALDTPLLDSFGVYHADESLFVEPIENDQTGFDLCTLSTAQILFHGTEIEIELGGIFPFNTVIFDGAGIHSFDILVFTGTQYETVYNSIAGSNHEICRFATVEGSSKLKIVSRRGDAFRTGTMPKVYRQS